jgi:sigma-B regulation protein RsbU (phosphoserine phosphatase)
MELTWDLPETIMLDSQSEAERIESLHSLNILGSPAEERFDRITRLATEFFQVPMAYVALIDSDRQWFKSSWGLSPLNVDRNLSLCQYTIHRGTPLVIPDAREHPIASTHPMVVGDPFLRFYAGVPLSGPRGHKIGTFCLLDTKPREFSEEQLKQLQSFAAVVEREVNLSDVIQTQHDLLSTREQLVATQERLRREFDDAAKYVRLMLPRPLTGREIIDWQFLPSAHLGGDGLGYRRINADQIAFYVLDVTGHGLGSALLAVTALELLRSRTVREIDYSSPALVIERLNRTFQMKDHAGKFFSAWYGVYTHSTRKITYANGGHPPALLLTAQSDGTSLLSRTAPGGPALGVLPEITAPETTIDFPRGSQLCVFTDGLYELLDENKDHGSYNEFVAHLQTLVAQGKPLYESMLHWLDRARDKKSIDDDVSLLRFMTKR